ncbi:MAG: hypothetical protein V5A43_04855 [Haloarculaceae archaeon]
MAIAAVVMIGFAVIEMAAEDYTAAGLSFLSASLVLYFRETRT